ncbi:DUF255 domain-containing protein [Lysobacter pythonis]|uniref:DUF255 domain-containing protein n=1 Tax=Solilutibacter pythonis TaxID=2483112 RepID=A0A3M2HYG9_9GAMM|nr:thioredoxin family protein [Lysobacter pythonis]RMH92883.1 DUF255 domain-containing protein [Lysobacter pythonis]
MTGIGKPSAAIRRALWRSLLWLAALLTLSLPAHAQVRASLVAADGSARAGQPFVVALKLEHAPRWHTFWRNAGTGLPTRIEWSLPAGWRAGGIEWPTPTLIRDKQGMVSGHGYADTTYLAVSLMPPKDLGPGEVVTLGARADWLMCDVECIPGKQLLSLMVPVSDEPPAPNMEVREALKRRSMPADATGWTLAASRDSARVTLHAAAPGGEMKDLHFFPLDDFIAYKQPQTSASRANRALLKIAVDPEETPPAQARLRGVLAYTDVAGAYRGVQVDVPFQAPAAATRAAGTGALAAGGGENAGPAGLTATLLVFALLGGLILNLMPCVFPVLGLKVVGFVEQAGRARRKVMLHALSFTTGVLLSFWALAGVLAVLRASGRELGWGFQLQSAPFVFSLAVLLLVFALNLGGLLEIGVRATSVGSRLQLKQGVAGSFFSGVLATVVATPCSAPFLAPALGAALTLPVAQSFVLFTLIALGLSLPYLLLSAFPQLVALLPRPGRWMESFKQAMAFPLYATAGYLLWVLAGQLEEPALLNAILALVLVALAAWIYGRFGFAGRRGGLAVALAAATFAGALWLGWPRAAKPEAVAWEPWSVERVAELQAEGRGIYVDFTARWCATCQVNKKVVFASRDVTDYFRRHDIVALKADWTNNDPAITAELAKWNRSAVPFNLVYRPGDVRPLPLPELLTPAIVLDAFEQGDASP